MKLAIRLAFRNLIGAGLRTWLNVIVLSFSFVIIIFMKGIMIGWDHQAKTDMTNYEIGGGQYWHKAYDPFDPFTLTDSHSPIPAELKDEIASGDIEPFLIAPGTLYPRGRLQSVVIKGINPRQSLFLLPSHKLDTITDAIPAIIGSLMARSIKASVGDRMTLRWRDVNGTFDAGEIEITGIFSSNVPTIESGQIYIPLEKLQAILMMPGEATILTFRDSEKSRSPAIDNWTLKTKDELTASVDNMIKTKSAGQTILYAILLLLAMLAIFDTQVLSIFRRQKEIGTYIALGYTRQQVVGLFTVEGTMHAILAALLSAAYGLPFLGWMARNGWKMPIDTSEFGMAIAQTLYPIYSAGLVVSTVLILTAVTAAVSYWPSRRIAKMNPTDALRGKLQ
jgi:ABC-type lipoprotein release transport system permease subunit